MTDKWYKAGNTGKVNTPAILIYPDRIEANIRKMIEIAGLPERIRPHVKTHKMPEIVKLQLHHGIRKFKCATIAEAEMTASAGAIDILLAMQPVGPALARFFNLRSEYRDVNFSCITDNEHDIDRISLMSASTGRETHVWLDLNVGMNRTGIIPGEEAVSLYKKIMSSPMLVAEGLHVYDGHIHEHDAGLRKKLAEQAFLPVAGMLEQLENDGMNNIRIVAGGTPTFPVHAVHKSAELSPGTGLLWDYGYSSSFSDLEFIHAAVLLTRVVSKPAPGLLCLDLGHKAVASEMPHPRVIFPDLSDYEFAGHNEEHLVIRTSLADSFSTGDELYAIPMHICPTIDRHDRAVVIRGGLVEEEWNIEARKRRINF
jgi:D-serine deaminase-like pyridoxal phosphate-dependent protein